MSSAEKEPKQALGELIAYCGVDCEVCPDYKSGACPSCRKTVWAEGDECMPAACCRERGICFCGECTPFPCSDMKEFYGESESHKKAFERMIGLNDSLNNNE